MKGQYSIKTLSILANLESDPAAALAELARNYHLRWLLAHADDGVIWGEVRDDGLHLSSDVFPQVSPLLRAVTLQQARLFGPDAELLIWKDGDGWRARLIQDGVGEGGEYYDEFHLFWGTKIEASEDGFVLLRDGKEGLLHAPPLPDDAKPPVRLKIRHYISYDSDGQAYIAYSRLTGMDAQGGER